MNGRVAERLGRGLQNLVRRFESAPDLIFFYLQKLILNNLANLYTMKFYLTKISLVCLVVFLVSSCVSKKDFLSLQTEKDELSTKLSKLETDLSAAMDMQKKQMGEIKDLKSNNKKILGQKDKLDKELSMLKEELGTTQTTITEMKTESEAKDAAINAMRSEITSAFSEVNSAISSSNMRINEIQDFLYLDLNEDINFGSGSTKIKKEDMGSLESIANMMKRNPGLAIIIEGHADKRSVNPGGRFTDNWDLSAARAAEVVRNLVEMGVNPKNLIAAGRGEHLPKAMGESKEDYQINRRAEAIVVPKIGKLFRMYKP